MGMPVTINIIDNFATDEDINEVFSYLHHLDKKFSTYIKDSEISKINRKEIKSGNYSNEMKKILDLCEITKNQTNGYFDIEKNGVLDPSGIVKGYAIYEAAKILKKKYKNFYIEIAGDIQAFGKNEKKKEWKVGIKNPFNKNKIIKVVNLTNQAIATSGNYERGRHIYNPKTKKNVDEIASITVVAANIFDADRFATAAFAMGEKGIKFIASLKGIEGYMIKNDRSAIFTQGFKSFVN